MAYTEAVVYASPREVYGWEHDETSESLVEVARKDLWEENNVPPAEVVYFPDGLTKDLPDVHYVVVDGHHRHNAALRAAKPFPVLAIDVGRERRDQLAEMALAYHGRGGYEPERNPYTPMTSKRPSWNADGAPTRHHLAETTEVLDCWDDLVKVEALRGPGVLDYTLGELVHDRAYGLPRWKVDGAKLELGLVTYDHAKSSSSTSYGRLELAYTGRREHPRDLDDLLDHCEVRASGPRGRGRTYKGREARDRPLRALIGLGKERAPHEVALEIVADTY